MFPVATSQMWVPQRAGLVPKEAPGGCDAFVSLLSSYFVMVQSAVSSVQSRLTDGVPF